MEKKELIAGHFYKEIDGSERVGRLVGWVSPNKVKMKMAHSTLICHWENFEPIPLTKQWLEKFGFVRENEWVGFMFAKYRMGLRFYRGNSAECDIIQDGKFISFGHGHIKYVHQLQNLCYALTGEDIAI